MILPPIGTRVVRGPDWPWGNQDGGQIGVVIEHIDSGCFTLQVKWLETPANSYRYTDIYKDVVPVNKSTFEELM